MNKFVAGKASVLVLTAAFAVAAFLLGKSLTSVLATQPEKILWCHCEPNGGCQTLNLPGSALQNAGHMDASGNPLHAGDHAGECSEETVDLCTNIEGNQESIPEGYYHTDEGECLPKTEVCADDSYANYGGVDGKFDQETETANNELCSNEEPTPTPSATPTSEDVCSNLDGIQTSIPGGYHKDSPDGTCNQFSDPGAPQGGSAPQGQVLGASTMAKTGSFAESAYLAIMALGGTLSAFSLKNLKKAFKKA